MSDEHPMLETLETIATKIGALSTSIDVRLDTLSTSIDVRLDTLGKSIDVRLDELKSQLRTDIEAVRGDVRLVAEAFATQTTHNRTTRTVLDDHDNRLKKIEKTA